MMMTFDSSEAVLIGSFDRNKHKDTGTVRKPRKDEYFLKGSEVYQAKKNFDYVEFEIIVLKSGFYVGQAVYQQGYGTGVVVSITPEDNSTYPINVKFEGRSSIRTYTWDGRFYQFENIVLFPSNTITSSRCPLMSSPSVNTVKMYANIRLYNEDRDDEELGPFVPVIYQSEEEAQSEASWDDAIKTAVPVTITFSL